LSRRFVHLHGFASNAQSVKGQRLAGAFARRGVSLETPDLNRPSFGEITYSACLAYLDELLAGDDPVRLSGSSFGGYLAARWAELHPGRIERLLLLCPAFDLVGRWPQMLGQQVMKQWERDGALPIPDRDGKPTSVHWELVEDARRHPTHPQVPCPTVIIHGSRDEIVPLASSRDYATSRKHVWLVEVDDVHTLENSIDVITRVALEHLLDERTP
jgi:hypothetical protein